MIQRVIRKLVAGTGQRAELCRVFRAGEIGANGKKRQRQLVAAREIGNARKSAIVDEVSCRIIGRQKAVNGVVVRYFVEIDGDGAEAHVDGALRLRSRRPPATALLTEPERGGGRMDLLFSDVDELRVHRLALVLQLEAEALRTAELVIEAVHVTAEVEVELDGARG
jgi:hypothetical protein